MARRVALIQCGDHRENQHRVLALAQAQAARGWLPVVMTYGADQGAFLLRHGVDVCSLNLHNDLRPGARLRSLAAAAVRAKRGGRYRGVDTTEVLRIERARAPHRFTSSAARYRWYLALVRRIDALTEVLDRTRPGHVYVWNGLTGVVANCLRILCKRRYLRHSFLERGIVPRSVFVDPQGTNGQSELCCTELDLLPAAQIALPDAGLAKPTAATRHAMRAQVGILTKRVVFVPLQVQRDTNILFHSDHIKTMRDLVDHIAEAVRGADVTVVVRHHPEETQQDLNLPEHDNVRYIDDGTVEQWCDDADVVVTINSTVGLTALLRGRPVISLGRAIYSNKGLCREVKPGELGTVLSEAATYEPPSVERTRRFYSALMTRYTAAPDSAPTLVEESACEITMPVQPFNRHGVRPTEIASKWRDVIERTRTAASADGLLQVSSQLQAGHTLDLTYRRDRAPVALNELGSGIATLLGISSKQIRITQHRGIAPRCRIVVAAQSQQPITSSTTLLVVDQYLEPHLGWLAARLTH